LNVTEPVGEVAPVRVALSLNDPPRLTDVAESVVDKEGLVMPTVTTSAVHGLDAGPLFVSPR
jgi:hypothetical protein